MTIIHTCVTKEWVKREIQKSGPDAVLTQKGLTLEQAFDVIDAIPTTNIPAEGCDNYDEHGRCKGHASPPVVSFLSDDDSDEDDATRLHIEGRLDYFVTVNQDRHPGGRATFRARTSGERDRRVTALIAALYKLGRNDLQGARAAAQTFIDYIDEDDPL